MGLTEGHWFEDEEPELTESQLEDILWEKNQIFERGYQKGFADGKAAILREQEPRVLTLEEVRDKAEYMFLEKRSETWSDLFGCAIRGDWDGYGMDLVLGEDDYIRGMWENYGKTWRCWTARPTDEQRRAVKWDD